MIDSIFEAVTYSVDNQVSREIWYLIFCKQLIRVRVRLKLELEIIDKSYRHLSTREYYITNHEAS